MTSTHTTTKKAHVAEPKPQAGTGSETTRSSELLRKALEQVTKKVAPVWPLADYVAINPYSGWASQSLASTRTQMRKWSNCELLMPLSHYASLVQSEQIELVDIAEAIERSKSMLAAADCNAKSIHRELLQMTADTATDEKEFSIDRELHVVSELLDRRDGSDWSKLIVDAISKHCGAHYDEGQSTWESPFKGRTLYQAWKLASQHDRSFELLGVSNFRRFVTRLPVTPEAALLALLSQLGVPKKEWESFLLCEAFTMPGWMGWTKYQTISGERSGSESGDLIGLLAIRLAYDVALSEANEFTISGDMPEVSFAQPSGETIAAKTKQIGLRSLMLSAHEASIERRLLSDLTEPSSLPSNGSGVRDQGSPPPARSLAQMVFCIDVRSERIRRHLESCAERIETLGFAGFFGLPLEFVRMGQEEGKGQVPVLLTPAFKVQECLHNSDAQEINGIIEKRSSIRSWRKSWKQFQVSAAGCFSFVESMGLSFVGDLLRSSLAMPKCNQSHLKDGVNSVTHDRIGPTLKGLHEQGITVSDQADMAQAILNNMGLLSNFSRFVVFCGHGSQTENNPLQAGLDCGACGGHSGKPNARFAAKLLNQKSVRQTLADRGIEIPEDTHFLPAVHNTTTDEISYFDIADVPATHRADLSELEECSRSAARRTQSERMPIVASESIDDLVKRSLDWSEVRPEWGLAGNQAFIAAPRNMTSGISLDGKSFLHSYDETSDPEGSVLESIMTAPLVVAHLINMQYYASTVDQKHFGSGSKTIHNVVGHFGVLSGNGGDLQTGLPIQSLHDGEKLVHEPVRLLAVIAAKRDSIDRVLAKHPHVAELVQNGWVSLISIEDGVPHRCTAELTWNTTRQPTAA